MSITPTNSNVLEESLEQFETKNNKPFVELSSRTNARSKDSSQELTTFVYNEEEKYEPPNNSQTRIKSLKKERNTSNAKGKKAAASVSGQKISEDNELNKEETIDDTRYYINYEGKLEFRKTKSVFGKFLETDDRIEIATSILNIILSKFEDELDKIVKHSLSALSQPSSTMTFHSTTFVPIKERIKKEKKKLKGKPLVKGSETKPGKNGKKIGKIVQYLGLPINLAKPKPFLDSRVEYKLVLSEKDIRSTVLSLGRSKPDRLNEIGSDSFAFPKTEQIKKKQVLCPFEICWCFGFDRHIPVLNLSTHKKSEIIFANAQYPVLYNYHDDTMRFLHGHRNSVSCMSIDSKGFWLATADDGPNNRVIIWDSRPCCVRILDNVHPAGTQLVGLSISGEYVVTVSPFPGQVLQLWKRNDNTNIPLVKKKLSESYGRVKKLTMSPASEEEFALTFENGVKFGFYCNKVCDDGKADLVLDTHILPPKYGSITDTAFFEDNFTALSSTSLGYVVTWVEESSGLKKVRQKHVRLQSIAITHIRIVENLVALATERGTVSFYDPSLTILYSSTKLKMEKPGPLVSLSFNLSPVEDGVESCENITHTDCTISQRKETGELYDATLQNKPFYTRDFVISTHGGQIGYFNVSKDSLQYLLYPSNFSYTTIDVYPHGNYLCAGTSSGLVILMDTSDCKIKVTKRINTTENLCQAVSLVKFSPSGSVLVCGMYTGALWVLDPLVLTPKFDIPQTFNQACIRHITFSPNEAFLAVADLNMCVAVYHLEENGRKVKPIDQYQAHSMPIRDLYFEEKEEELYLYSLGMDRNIAEFLINQNTMTFQRTHRVEQSALPLCIIPYPPSEHLFYFTVNSELKYKFLDKQNLKCYKTIQAPDLGCPIDFFEVFPLGCVEREHCIVFGAGTHIGLQMIPTDGNPFLALAQVASPSPIICCKIQPIGKVMFTISENSGVINMWQINSWVVESQYKAEGEGLDPFLDLLEGGRGGWRERDLRDFFLVGQFMHQGENASVLRTLSDRVRACEIISIFQALGFFPTQHQIDNIMFELVGENHPYSYSERQVTFAEFVKLYINHRPCRDMTFGDLHQGFTDFYKGVSYQTELDEKVEPVFTSSLFVEKLMMTGEEMPSPTIINDLNILMNAKIDLTKDIQQGLPYLSFLPKELTFETFVKDLLGFDNENLAKCLESAHFSD